MTLYIYNKYKNNNLDMEQYSKKESQKRNINERNINERYGINNYQELEHERQKRYGEYPIGKVQYIYQYQNLNNDYREREDYERELKRIVQEFQQELKQDIEQELKQDIERQLYDDDHRYGLFSHDIKKIYK